MSQSSPLKSAVLAIIVIASFFYSLPNIYGDDPAIQISALNNQVIPEELIQKSSSAFKANLKTIEKSDDNTSLLLRFNSTNAQLQAIDKAEEIFADANYSVALNLAAATPAWLEKIGAEPMKLGLDLRGGIRFLMQVDVDSNITRRIDSYQNDLRKFFIKQQLRYNKIKRLKDHLLLVEFENSDLAKNAFRKIKKQFHELAILSVTNNSCACLQIGLHADVIQQIRNYTMAQTVTILNNRVNELGIAESIVQRQGVDRIVIELPGIQDSARAKEILGKTATVEFLMHQEMPQRKGPVAQTLPYGSKIYYTRSGEARLLKDQVILSGESITHASSGFDSQNNEPIVSIRLGGDISAFKKATRENIGKLMATLYVEDKDGVQTKTVISSARINQALGNNFQISGLTITEARDLALLLRSGAMPASVKPVEERIIGPSLGSDNIERGLVSLLVGLCLVFIIMAVYYKVFGLLANIALMFNLILLVAILSIIGATLTLPGIAGIVLTLGMAVDANVLIFERIREELHKGSSNLSSIANGFKSALATIVDANITTLIAGLVLFAMGTGPVKGFAVTLSIGILTSMFTATTLTKVLVNLVYSKRNKKLAIGI